MQDRAVLRPARAGVHAPLLGRSLDQQHAAYRAGLAQRRPEGADRGREARRLNVENRIGIQRVVGRSVLESNLVQPDLQLLRQQHRHGGVDALAHLDHRHDQRHGALTIDADEGVRGEDGRRRSRGPGGARREMYS